MSDLDVLIRKAVVEIVEASPAAPPFEDLTSPAAITSARSQEARRWPVILAAVVVLFVALGFGAWLATRPGDVGRVRTSVRPHRSQPEPPAAVTGTEQHLSEIPVPDEFAATLRSPVERLVVGTDATAFSVDGTSPLVLAQISGRPPTPERQYLSVLTNGTLLIGGQGLGIQTRDVTMDAVDAGEPATFSTWDFPVPGQRLDVWTRLPEGTAYVTLDYGTAPRLWERPVNDTVAFLSTIPEIERRQYVPNPARATFTAYAQDGRVLAHATER